MPHLVEPEIKEIAVRANSADLVKGSRQGTLIDAGYAAQLCNPHERPDVCPRNLLTMLNNVSIPLMSRRRSDLASVLPAHCGTSVEAKRFIVWSKISAVPMMAVDINQTVAGLTAPVLMLRTISTKR